MTNARKKKPRSAPAMDRKTIEELKKIASREYEEARVAFENDDNIEDMHLMHRWEATFEWLERFQ